MLADALRFIHQVMNVLLKMMDSVSKRMDFVSKMMSFGAAHCSWWVRAGALRSGEWTECIEGIHHFSAITRLQFPFLK